MMLDTDRKHIEWCCENNDGFCPYRRVKCCGVCNNCGLDASPDARSEWKPLRAERCLSIELVPRTDFYMNEPI